MPNIFGAYSLSVYEITTKLSEQDKRRRWANNKPVNFATPFREWRVAADVRESRENIVPRLNSDQLGANNVSDERRARNEFAQSSFRNYSMTYEHACIADADKIFGTEPNRGNGRDC